MRYTKSEIDFKPLPKVSDIKGKNINDLVKKVNEYSGVHDSAKYYSAIDELVNCGLTEREIAAALFGMNVKKTVIKNDTAGSEINYGRSYKKENDRKAKRPEKRRDKQFAPKIKAEDMTTIRISIGRNDHVAPNHILAAVAGESGLPGSVMGSIDIQRSFTTVEVPKKYKSIIVKSLKNAKIKGRTVSAK